MSQAAPHESNFVAIETSAALDELIARSHETPVVLFKHSLTCPISARAYRQMEQLGGEIALVVVQRAREVSRAVETATGVPHESPQVFILRNGQAAWSTSHFDITTDAVSQAAREHQ